MRGGIIRVNVQSGNSAYYGLGSTTKRSSESVSENVTENSGTSRALTEEELELAKEYKDFKEYSEFLSEAFFNKTYTREEINAVIGAHKVGGQTGISANISAAQGVQVLELNNGRLTPVEVSPSVRKFTESVERPPFNIPKGNVQVDKDNNTIEFAIGGKINLGFGYIYISDNHVSAFKYDQVFGDGVTLENSQLDYTKEGYAGIVQSIINASEKTNEKFSKSFSEKAINFLDEVMGMDTTKDMHINGTTFEVVDGQLQTKGYVYSKEEVMPEGMKYLRNLLERAYEQNLI